MINILLVMVLGQLLFIIFKIMAAAKMYGENFKLIQFMKLNYISSIINMTAIVIIGICNSFFIFLPPVGLGLLLVGSGIEAFLGKLLKIV